MARRGQRSLRLVVEARRENSKSDFASWYGVLDEVTIESPNKLHGLNVEHAGSRCQVPAKAQWKLKLLIWRIDAVGGWRYSQAQIPNLVANAIPRFRKAAQSFGSIALCVRRIPAESGFVAPAGAKAHVHSRLLAAQMNSCPDTKHSWNRSISQALNSCPDVKLCIYANCSVLNCQHVFFSGITFLAGGETDAAGETDAVAFGPICRHFTSTLQRRIGGRRNL